MLPLRLKLYTDTFSVYVKVCCVIQLYSDGEASRLIQHWKVGILTKWKGPFGGFSYLSNKYRKLVMLACGSGIAPFIQLIRHVVENEDDYTQIVLFYSVHKNSKRHSAKEYLR